jgi:ABC-type uncharacterized transport system involved in gliding motility auxiliary subunit
MNRILNIVGWLGTALVAAALVIRFGFPTYDRYAFYLALGGLVCVLLYMLSQWREIAGMFTRRQARYGTLTGVSILVVLGILIAINYIGKQQSKRWDLTAAKQYSLSDQSRNVLAKLDAPLKIRVFERTNANQPFIDRLKEYEYGSKQVSVEYIDPDTNPAPAQQANVTQYGTILLDYKGRTERVTMNTEQDITNAIIKAVSGTQRKVYFTQGHGERSIDDSERLGFSAVTNALKGENYLVDKLAIVQQGKVPDDAAVVVVGGPKSDFLAPEIDALKAYLDKGGKLFLALDPPEKADSPPLTNLVGLAKDWSIEVGNNVVVDVSGMGQLFGAGPAVPIAVSYPPHAITDRFNVMTVFPMSRSVAPVSGGSNNRTAQTIIETSGESWAETDLKGIFAEEKIGPDESSGDKKGPISIASAVSSPVTPVTPDSPPDTAKPETRVVVFGDSDFATNSTVSVAGNRDLFMNVIGWLSQQENLISVRPKDPEDRRLTLTSTQQVNINWIAMLGIPGAIFAMGIYTWWRRR